jgi:hypothetical protein
MFTLYFSHIVEGKRIPLILDGREVTLPVEAISKSDAINKPEVKTFCENHGETVRVRRIL